MDQLQDTAELDLLIESGTPPERIIAESVPDKPKGKHYGKSPWNETTDIRLRELIAAGLSCGVIASIMRLSRNSIIGRVNRQGLSHLLKFRVGKPRKAGKRSRSKQKAPVNFRTRISLGSFTQYREEIPAVIPDLPPDQSPDAVNLMGLTASSCRWPLGDPRQPDFMFCGSTKLETSPYCQRHRDLSVGHHSHQFGHHHYNPKACGGRMLLNIRNVSAI